MATARAPGSPPRSTRAPRLRVLHGLHPDPVFGDLDDAPHVAPRDEYGAQVHVDDERLVQRAHEPAADDVLDEIALLVRDHGQVLVHVRPGLALLVDHSGLVYEDEPLLDELLQHQVELPAR